jgi:Putative peptidoglycan-binding domain-containing protein
MTENEIRQKVVTTAKKYIGCRESDNSHRQFVDRYNSFSPLPRGHRMTYSAAWCATFVSAIAIECKLTDIIPVECGCGYMIALYKKIGRWREDEHYVPKAGDVIFYDWQDGKDFATTDNLGAPDHVGIVTGAADGIISVIEGNKNDAVAFRTVAVNGRYIRGFGLPDYSSRATPEVKPSPKPKAKCPFPEPKFLIRYGSTGDGVRWVQWHLNFSGTGAKLKVDGSFGVLTKAAVISFQKRKGLQPDGIVGSKTRGALRRAVG